MYTTAVHPFSTPHLSGQLLANGLPARLPRRKLCNALVQRRRLILRLGLDGGAKTERGSGPLARWRGGASDPHRPSSQSPHPYVRPRTPSPDMMILFQAFQHHTTPTTHTHTPHTHNRHHAHPSLWHQQRTDPLQRTAPPAGPRVSPTCRPSCLFRASARARFASDVSASFNASLSCSVGARQDRVASLNTCRGTPLNTWNLHTLACTNIRITHTLSHCLALSSTAALCWPRRSDSALIALMRSASEGKEEPSN
jgi:hypothetical protein